MRKIILMLVASIFIFACDSEEENNNKGNVFQWGSSENDIGVSASLEGNDIVITGIKDKSIFAYKISKDNKIIWNKDFLLETKESISKVVVKVLNNSIYIFGNLNLEVVPGELPIYKNYLLVIKLDSNGNEIYKKKLLEAEQEFHQQFVDACEDNDSFYILFKKVENSENSSDIFVYKLTQEGAASAYVNWGSNEEDNPVNIFYDKERTSIYVTGTTRGKFKDSDIILGGSDVFVSEIKDKKVNWTSVLGSSQDDYPTDISADKSGNIYVLGTTDGKILNESKGNKDIFISILNIKGEVTNLQKQFGTDSYDFSSKFVIDDYIYVSGYTEGAVKKSFGKKDVYFAKLDKELKLIEEKQWGSNKEEEVFSIFKIGDEIFILGNTNGELSKSSGKKDLFLIKE